MIVYIYNIGVDLYNGFNGLRHRINWTYYTVLDGLAHPLYSMCNSDSDFCLVWEAMVKYMIKVIYTNNKNYDENQPCRNKIAHGEQTNFNTKEHALKCILILDLIINFSDSLLNNTL